MKETTYLETAKKDGCEMADFLKDVPMDQKGDVLLLVNAFNLGVETERRRKEPEQKGA